MMYNNENKLYYGDNLDILRRKIDPESVDLCYIDPPFNSKRNYFQIYNNQGSDDRAQAQAFTDTWEWGDEAENGLAFILDVTNLQNGKFTEQTVELLRGLEKVLGKGALLAYLVHMTLRIVEIHRVMKPTGSFYLHCDPTASHYLKLILDSVFCGQGGNFMNEIIWCYKSGGATDKYFSRKHDTIFLYTKTRNYFFNSSKEKSYMGIGYNTGNKNVILYDDSDGLGPYTVVNVKDWWQDIGMLSTAAKERLGYPTQKPESLLERIIKASSNEGDVVLDAYCGSGTTVAVAQRLGRKWIGIDKNKNAIKLIEDRLKSDKTLIDYF